MRKIILFFAAVCLSGIFFFACSKEEIKNDTGSVEVAKTDENFISLKTALSTADKYFSSLFPETATKGVSARIVSSVDYLKSVPVTRAEDENAGSSLMYLVNYAGDKGFALLSGDARTKTPVYAISDEGNFNLQDTCWNKGLAAFLRIAESDVAMATSVTTKSQPTVTIDYRNVNIIVNPQVGPLLWQGASRWGQGAPFNKYCFTESGDTAMVGCTAVSIGMIMSYYSWPEKVDDTSLNWRTMKKDGKIDCTYKLLAKLGEKDLLDMNYGVKSSSASIANYPRTFTSMGYKTPNNFVSFSDSSIRNVLDQASPYSSKGYGPVLIYAAYTTPTVGAHSFVIDGYALNIVKDSSATVDIDYNTTLFHCVWGWAGSKNGYYYWGDDKCFQGKAVAYSPNDIANEIKLKNTYNQNVMYMTGFIPDK